MNEWSISEFINSRILFIYLKIKKESEGLIKFHFLVQMFNTNRVNTIMGTNETLVSCKP